MRDIGKNIRQLRIEQNMTQDDLAERLFVTRQTVSNYETGKSRPGVDMLVTIAEVLETDIQTVIYGPEPKNPRIRRLVIAMILTAVLGLAIWILNPTAEELARNQYSVGLRYFLSMILKPMFYLAMGWTAAQTLGMALKKKPLCGIWTRWIGLIFALTILIWLGFSSWYFSGQAPAWMSRAAYAVYVFFYRISVPYHAVFLLPGAA